MLESQRRHETVGAYFHVTAKTCLELQRTQALLVKFRGSPAVRRTPRHRYRTSGSTRRREGPSYANV
jgi:hypothetical protein